METISTDLRTKIVEWQSKLRQTSLNEDDREELKNHLDDLIAELKEARLHDDEIWMLAMKRIGPLSTIEEEYGKVNPDLVFRKNGTLLIYGGMLMLFLQCVFILVPAYFYKHNQSDHGDFATIILLNKWSAIFYFLSILFVGTSVALIFKGKVIIKYLSPKVMHFNIFSALFAIFLVVCSGFCLIQLLEVGKTEASRAIASSFKTLTQFFYFGQVALVAYFLLIGNKRHIRGLLSFNRQINWKIALFLGICVGIAITFTFTYPVIYLPLLIGAPLLGVLGWMLSFSKRPIINLFCCQLYLMILCGSEIPGQHTFLFMAFYLFFLFFLFCGYSFQRFYNFFRTAVN